LHKEAACGRDPWAGQTAGGISEILPVATIMRRLIVETEAQFAIADREENVLAASCRGVVCGHTIRPFADAVAIDG
jgi:hypothetical protein